jgi:hypothetical protein
MNGLVKKSENGLNKGVFILMIFSGVLKIDCRK